MKERKQQSDIPLTFQVPAVQRIIIKDHSAFCSIYTGIDFNLVHSVFPKTFVLPTNTAKPKQIFAAYRKHGIQDIPLSSFMEGGVVATVTENMLEIYGDDDCGSGSLLKQTQILVKKKKKKSQSSHIKMP